MIDFSVIFAGFGGQGILSAGKMAAEAALYEGKEVSWFPSYGPEMRGGTANCSVVISDEPIGSPVVNDADVVICLNQPSMEKFEKQLKPGALMRRFDDPRFFTHQDKTYKNRHQGHRYGSFRYRFRIGQDDVRSYHNARLYGYSNRLLHKRFLREVTL